GYMGESAVVSRQPSCAFCGNRRLAQQTTEGAGFRGSKKMPAPQSAIRRRQWRVHTETLIAQLGAAAMAPPPCQLDWPRPAWCWRAPRSRGSAFGFLPGDVLGQHQGSSPPERRWLMLAPKLRVVCPTPDSWRAKFSQAQPHQLQNLFGLGGRCAATPARNN